MKSVRSVSFGAACCCGSCLTIFVLGTATVRVTVSGFAIFFGNATTLLLVLNSCRFTNPYRYRATSTKIKACNFRVTRTKECFSYKGCVTNV